jgi:glutathione peroxidase
MKTILASILSLCICLNQSVAQNIYEFTVNNIDGKPVQLSKYKGKVLLIVNTASKCGLTPQYSDLQSTYEKYEDKEFLILGFPANNFMGQEPGNNNQIKEFCTSKFNVSFPMFSKISVKGKNIHPLYKFLTSKEKNGKVDAPVSWNFQKFLIDKEGKVITSFAPGEKVTENKVINAIEKLLRK